MEQKNTGTAALAHVLGLLTGIIAPLIMYFVLTDEDEFVKENVREALNFQITMIIAFFIAGALTIILIGILIIPVLAVLDIVFCIMAAMKSSKGEEYRYPIALRIV